MRGEVGKGANSPGKLTFCVGRPCCQATNNPSTSDYFPAQVLRSLLLVPITESHQRWASSSVRDRVIVQFRFLTSKPNKRFPMIPSGTRSFHNLLKIWTNLTWLPRPNQSLRGLTAARRQGNKAFLP